MALATFADLRTEFLARGFDYLDAAGTTRQDQFLNQAYLELCEEEPWPFLEVTVTGSAPLSITDLGSVASIVDTGANAQLHRSDRRTLIEAYVDLTTTGTPQWYYITTGNTISTYPVGGSLSVRYWKIPAELSGSTDVPVVPQRFRNLIIDGAARRAYIDRDNFDAAGAIESERQAGIERMRESLLNQNHGEPELVVDAYGGDWGYP